MGGQRKQLSQWVAQSVNFDAVEELIIAIVSEKESQRLEARLEVKLGDFVDVLSWFFPTSLACLMGG